MWPSSDLATKQDMVLHLIFFAIISPVFFSSIKEISSLIYTFMKPLNLVMFINLQLIEHSCKNNHDGSNLMGTSTNRIKKSGYKSVGPYKQTVITTKGYINIYISFVFKNHGVSFGYC